MNTKFPIAPSVLLLLAVAPSLYSCTRTIVTGSFERVPNAAVEYAYVNEQADFSKYTRLMSDPLDIYFPDGAGAPDPADLQRIRDYFRVAFTEALGDDYQVVREAGPDVLKVRAQIIDMVLTSGGAEFDPGGRLRDVVAHGELTFLMELSDSVTGQVLARAGDKSTDISTESGDATWDDVRRAAEYWASLFRSWLDKSLGKAT